MQQTKLTREQAKEQIIKICKETVETNGVENTLVDLLQTQFTSEQVQSEMHCLLQAVIELLISKKVFTGSEIDSVFTRRKKQQEEDIKKQIEEEILKGQSNV